MCVCVWNKIHMKYITSSDNPYGTIRNISQSINTTR